MRTDISATSPAENARDALLLTGPALSVVAASAALDRIGMPSDWASMAVWTMLALAWTPLFCSVPALLTQDVRDRTLPGLPRLQRAVLLVPALLSETSPVRRAQLASLVGLCAGIAAALLV